MMYNIINTDTFYDFEVSRMKLHTMGIAYPHDSGFSISRPNGSGDNLLLIFKTPAFIQCGGEQLTVPRDTAVLFAKSAPQIYGATGAEYVNHWVHFECAEDDIFFEKAGVQFNVPLAVRSISSAESVLELLRAESISSDKNSGECVDLLLRLLIAKTVGSDGKSPSGHHSEKLRALRAEIYGNPSRRFTVNELAARLLLSPSHFQALYKSEFGISCYEDVLKAKTELAAYYLKNTALPVKRIAELCGYENDVHFMRQFKKRTGLSAVEFRKSGREIPFE